MIYAATLRAREGAAYMREPTTLATRLANLRDLALNAAPRAPEPPIQDLLDSISTTARHGWASTTIYG